MKYRAKEIEAFQLEKGTFFCDWPEWFIEKMRESSVFSFGDSHFGHVRGRQEFWIPWEHYIIKAEKNFYHVTPEVFETTWSSD